MNPRSRSLIALSVLFVAAGALHFAVPGGYLRIVPRWLPAPLLLVYLSGACEVLLGLLLLPERTRRAAGWGLVALLAAVFPANVQMLQDAQGSFWRLLLWLRLPLQALLALWVYRAAIRRGQGSGSRVAA